MWVDFNAHVNEQIVSVAAVRQWLWAIFILHVCVGSSDILEKQDCSA